MPDGECVKAKQWLIYLTGIRAFNLGTGVYYRGTLSDIPLAKVFFVAWSAYLKKQNWKHEHKYMKKMILPIGWFLNQNVNESAPKLCLWKFW